MKQNKNHRDRTTDQKIDALKKSIKKFGDFQDQKANALKKLKAEKAGGKNEG